MRLLLVLLVVYCSIWLPVWSQNNPNDISEIDSNAISAGAQMDSSIPATTNQSGLLQRIRSAGLVGVLILSMSVISLAMALSQISSLRKQKVCPREHVRPIQEAILNGELERANSLAQSSKSVLGRVVLSVIDHLEFDFTENSSLAGNVASRELKKLMHRNTPILIVSTSATLLGLLGTVVGMIGSFEAVAMAGSLGDPSIMANDISFALVTTAMGLSVALPSLIIYHLLKNRIHGLAIELDEQVSGLLSEVYKNMRLERRREY